MGNGLIYYVQDGGKAKFKADSGMYRVQFGGGGKVATMKNILELTVTGSGTLTMKARSGGDVQRALIVEIDGVKTNADGYATPVKTETPADFEVDCSAAKAGSKIYIYSSDSSINLYNLKWTGK
ncbi:MAG: hypothetical protein IJ028_05440 [Alistipes sp.]|nr:hypothetical protein [Alistipes sp.]